MQFKIHTPPPKPCIEWMEDDFRTLKEAEILHPTLLFHNYKAPAITYGYFRNPEEHLLLAKVTQKGLDLAKRPTGGGLLFHLSDLAFSLFIPEEEARLSKNPEENYRWINGLVKEALSPVIDISLSTRLAKQGETYPFCFSNPTIFDLYFEGKKVGGAAQRRTKKGLLHQGSLFLSPPDPAAFWSTIEETLIDKAVAQQMKKESGFLSLSRQQAIDLLSDLLYTSQLIFRQNGLA